MDNDIKSDAELFLFISAKYELWPKDFPEKDAVEEVSLTLTVRTYENGDAESSTEEKTDTLTFTVKK